MTAPAPTPIAPATMTAADWAHRVRTLAAHIHAASYDLHGADDRIIDAYYEALTEYERLLWLEDLAAHHVTPDAIDTYADTYADTPDLVPA